MSGDWLPRLFTCAVLAVATWFALLALVGERVPQAFPARLIGQCHGQLLAGMEEDEFPEGCDWIEPIRTQ